MVTLIPQEWPISNDYLMKAYKSLDPPFVSIPGVSKGLTMLLVGLIEAFVARDSQFKIFLCPVLTLSSATVLFLNILPNQPPALKSLSQGLFRVLLQ